MQLLLFKWGFKPYLSWCVLIVMFLFPKPCVILALGVIASVLWFIKLTDIWGRTLPQDLCSLHRACTAFSTAPLNQTSIKPKPSTSAAFPFVRGGRGPKWLSLMVSMCTVSLWTLFVLSNYNISFNHNLYSIFQETQGTLHVSLGTKRKRKEKNQLKTVEK